MKLEILIGFLLLISCGSFLSDAHQIVESDKVNNEYSHEDSLILWSKEYQLKWSDYLGKPDYYGKNRSHQAVTSVRKSTSKWEVSESEIEFSASCYLLRFKSWKKVEGDNLLRHERGHFDIVEVEMRRFRKSCSLYKSYDLQKTIDFFYSEKKKMKENIRRMQDLYDQETDFSKNKEEQAKWNEKIKRMLKETEPWSDTKVVIKRY